MKGGRLTVWRWTDDPGLRAVIGIDVSDRLAECKPWLALAYGTTCLAAAIYLSVQHVWPMALIWAVWSVVAVRRWFWMQPWVRKFAKRR